VGCGCVSGSQPSLTNHLFLQVLQAASRLANRRPGEVVRLLQANPSATLTDSGAIVFGCNMHPDVHGTHNHGQHIHEKPRTQQQQHQQQTGKQRQQGRSSQLQPRAASSLGQGKRTSNQKDTQQQALKLHSRPSATRKLHLEFQGCVTEVRCYCQGLLLLLPCLLPLFV
jgi:hypothetical protein